VDEFETIKEELKKPHHQFLLDPSPEYAPAFINARVSGETWWFQGNVINHGLIDNLPEGACVEVPVLVNQHGVFASHVGSLPPQLAALDRHAIALQELTVEAALTRNKDLVYQAAMMDPLVSSVLPLHRIWDLVDDMFAAHGSLIPPYSSGRLAALKSAAHR
jgi:alpha-galactosidase